MPTLYVRGGHVFHLDTDPARKDRPVTETPREQAQAFADAKARWSAIVDLMLAGKRLTGGTTGKVIDERRSQ